MQTFGIVDREEEETDDLPYVEGGRSRVVRLVEQFLGQSHKSLSLVKSHQDSNLMT